ncbi:MAG: TIGR03545 family protein, partial [Elusimicrobiota bacterium]
MRRKGLITVLVIAVVVFVFGFFLLDNIIEGSIEKIGTAIWGAKIEVGDVNIKWSPLSMEIIKFTAASRKHEFKNLIDIGKMKFSVIVSPLFEGKINIEEVSGQQLGFNTKRKKSGFLPKEKKKKRQKTIEKWKEKLSDMMEGIKTRGVKKIEVLYEFKQHELKTPRVIDNIEKEFNKTKNEIERLKQLNAQKIVDDLKQSIKEIESIKIKNVQDAVSAQEKISKFQDSLKKAENFQKNINNRIEKIKSSLNQINRQLYNLNQAKQQDMKAIMGRLKLPSFETREIAEVIFGPLLTDKFKTVLEYREKIKKHVPPKQEKKVKRPREQGTDIVFIKEKMNPPFWIKKALISGKQEQMIQVSNYSPAPWITGKPVSIKAENDQFDLEIVLDRTTEIAKDLIKGTYN